MADLVTRDNLLIQQGDDRPLVWTLSDSTGAPVNLAGYSAKAQVRERAEPLSPVLHEWSTDDGTAELADSTVSLSLIDSESWTWTRGFYDLHVTDFAGRTEVVVRGSVAVVPGITR